ncbi:helix-turn-helix domain-containing protein [Cytobacillus sp. S13-E01]|uniref:PucR family transcriptional regulator n=1 Tax=Cytobacillus sp. S13-E01 TaxID=3031326 RepID=UPI0023D8B8E9|nr:helix-turn-helix domain-containing protein [Cytobacillus sp. S13-E01]MDF0726879.1 helix-turn-helix domain-containing protein [Cytobacillus sp. S13-E01]
MLEKLKRHYKDALIVADTAFDDNYLWFSSDSRTLFGIRKNAISEKEAQLLGTLFETDDYPPNLMTEEQTRWYQYLYSGDSNRNVPRSNFSRCRFIHFFTSKAISDKQNFQLATESLFPSEVIVVWENTHSGIIIEKMNDQYMTEITNLEDVVDIFTSDFYLDVNMLTGQIYSLDSDVKSQFEFERLCFKTAMKYIHKQKVFSIQDVIPLFLLENVDPIKRQKISNVLLPNLQDDLDQLKTIKVFLESNLNVSSAAKKLYMHRNSLQYRIDKFIEQTGIDIKHFHGAVTVFLAILVIEHFNEPPDS